MEPVKAPGWHRRYYLVELDRSWHSFVHLVVAPERAESFYAEKVDAVAEGLATRFFDGRSKILDYVEELEKTVER